MREFEDKPFLPTQKQVAQLGSGLVIVIAHMMYHMSWVLPLSLLWLIPQGDRLSHVASRLFVIALSLLVHYQLLKYKRSNFRRLFGGSIEDQVLDAYAPIIPEPTSARVAIKRNWHLGIVAALMLPIVTGAIDFNVPWADTRASTGKSSWVNPSLEWLRTHPNSTLALAWLLILVSLGLLLIRIRIGRFRQVQALKENAVQR